MHDSSSYRKPDATDQEKNYVEALEQNVINWRGILARNNRLKQQARPWPQLLRHLTFNRNTSTATGEQYEDYSSQFRLEGDDIVVGFAGAMGGIGFELDEAAIQSAGEGEGTTALAPYQWVGL